MSDRQWRIYRVDGSVLRAHPDLPWPGAPGWQEAYDEIPLDAQVVRETYAIERDAYLFAVEHDSFDAVAPGCRALESQLVTSHARLAQWHAAHDRLSVTRAIALTPEALRA